MEVGSSTLFDGLSFDLLSSFPDSGATSEVVVGGREIVQALVIAAGARTRFDEEARRSLILEELRYGYNPTGTARQIAAMAATGDLRGRLAKVSAPTLVIHGGDDRLVHPDFGRDIAASIAGAGLKIVDGMGA